jgi:hypothetical protein
MQRVEIDREGKIILIPRTPGQANGNRDDELAYTE